jgi:glycosyltransferase involved in cell wall biosynthesis
VRLGLVIYGSLNTVSGGFLYDRMLVTHLRSQGDDVEVVSLPWRAYGPGLLDNLSPRLLNRLSRADFQVLLQDELAHPSLFWLNRRLKARGSCPLVAIVHHLRGREARPAWQKRLYAWVERQYLATVDAHIYISQTTRADVESLVGSGRPAVVANPGGDRLPGAPTREEIVVRALTPGPLRLIFVGNLTPRKELHTLLAALAGLPLEDWVLTVAGSLTMDPAYTKKIRRQMARWGLDSRVALLGYLGDAELARRLSASHLLAVPSSYEGFGIVYLEAMRLGLPAIAGSNGAAREIITPGQDGFLVPPGDAAALARCLGRLAGDRELLARMSLAALERARAHPTWGASGAAVHRFLHQLVEG